jgi:hypothetical protein
MPATTRVVVGGSVGAGGIVGAGTEGFHRLRLGRASLGHCRQAGVAWALPSGGRARGGGWGRTVHRWRPVVDPAAFGYSPILGATRHGFAAYFGQVHDWLQSLKMIYLLARKIAFDIPLAAAMV